VVATQGLPGRHHLYITFRTDHPGVSLADGLRARYPTEMTIVLQHEFWGLEVEDDRFSVLLKFGGVPQRLEIPFEALSVFADPSVEFGLQFGAAAASAVQRDAAAEPPGAVAEQGEAVEPDEAVEPGAKTGSAQVVTLDRFRKK
jgi:hypothetical protein